MWDDIWPLLANDYVNILLAGGVSLAIQMVALAALHRFRQVYARRSADASGELTLKAVAQRRIERRLSAILVADVVGYSRLTEADEEGTHDCLTTVRCQIVDPIVGEHWGRVVKNTGDGALVEFSSAVNAVRCAIKLQEVLAARNANVSPDRRIEFRVGINLADVIVESNDVYGDGVNIAARLEGLAQPGGICLSADTWRYVRGKISVRVVDLGEKQLRNIAEPAHVYAIAPPLDFTPAPSPRR